MSAPPAARVSFSGLPPGAGGGAIKPPQRTSSNAGSAARSSGEGPPPEPPRIGTLQHMAYSCPGFSSPDARLEISSEPMSFFFREPRAHQIIPLFQRTYCWTEDQGRKWFADVVSKFTTVRHMSEYDISIRRHTVGKIVVKRVRHNVGGAEESPSAPGCCGTDEDDSCNDGDEAAEDDETGEWSWSIVDGQQRITTTSLQISSLRDRLMSIADELTDHLSVSAASAHSGELRSVVQQTLVGVIQPAIMRMNELVFVDVAAAEAEARRLAEREVKTTHDALLSASSGHHSHRSHWDDDHDGSFIGGRTALPPLCEEGLAHSFLRLVPSYNDRAPYSEIVMRRMVDAQARRIAAEQEQHVHPHHSGVPHVASSSASKYLETTGSPTRAPHSGRRDTHAVRLSLSAEASAQGRMRRVLDHALDDWLAASVAKTDSGADAVAVLCEQAKLISELSALLLEIVSCVVVRLTTEVNLAQVFLWLQEKSLFSLGALLYNPAPGIKFRASDLARNLLLAPSMLLPMREQERIHLERWVVPVERAVLTFVRDYNRLVAEGAALRGGDGAQTLPPLKRSAVEMDRVVVVASSAMDGCEASLPLPGHANPPPRRDSHASAPHESGATVEGGEASGGHGANVVVSRYLSPFEKQVQQMAVTLRQREFDLDTHGMLVYARFYSAFETRLRDALIEEGLLLPADSATGAAPTSPAPSVRDVQAVEERVCDAILSEMGLAVHAIVSAMSPQ